MITTMIDGPVATIDTNVILRHLLNDHAEHSPRASRLLLEVRQGRLEVYCPDTVIFEAVYILTGLASTPRDVASNALVGIIELPGVVMAYKAAILDALRFWVEQPALDFADCYHLALTKSLGLAEIYTFDRKMDRYPGVVRVEP